MLSPSGHSWAQPPDSMGERMHCLLDAVDQSHSHQLMENIHTNKNHHSVHEISYQVQPSNNVVQANHFQQTWGQCCQPVEPRCPSLGVHWSGSPNKLYLQSKSRCATIRLQRILHNIWRRTVSFGYSNSGDMQIRQREGHAFDHITSRIDWTTCHRT